MLRNGASEPGPVGRSGTNIRIGLTTGPEYDSTVAHLPHAENAADERVDFYYYLIACIEIKRVAIAIGDFHQANDTEGNIGKEGGYKRESGISVGHGVDAGNIAG